MTNPIIDNGIDNNLCRYLCLSDLSDHFNEPEQNGKHNEFPCDQSG